MCIYANTEYINIDIDDDTEKDRNGESVSFHEVWSLGHSSCSALGVHEHSSTWVHIIYV